MLMEAYWEPTFSEVLMKADLLTPDGMPLVWMVNALRGRRHDRVAGMDILLALCDRSPQERVSIYFLGSTDEILTDIHKRLRQDFPELLVAGLEALPFRPLTPEEDQQVIDRINASGAGILFLSLGCPKQEIWMSQHRDRIKAVMIGIGGVFPIYAGHLSHAPSWVRDNGLEWFYRLVQEPKRLWKRYTKTIPPFVFLSMKQVITQKGQQALKRDNPDR